MARKRFLPFSGTDNPYKYEVCHKVLPNGLCQHIIRYLYRNGIPPRGNCTLHMADSYWGYTSVCVYVCVCMYACMYVCVYVCIYVCMYVCMHACMYVCMYVCVYVCMYACMCLCVCVTYTCMQSEEISFVQVV